MIELNAKAPDFTLVDTESKRSSLGDLLAEGPVLLFFIKSGCATTELAGPVIEELWKGYADHVSAEETRLHVVGVGQEPAPVTRELRQSIGLSFPVLVDEDLGVSRAYDLDATPTVLLLRGVERLRADSQQVAAGERFRIVEVIEGWSRSAYAGLRDEIAARIGAIPIDLSIDAADVPETRPG